jgi:hypothetical protein
LDEKKATVHDEGEAPKPKKKSDAQILKHVLGKVEEAKKVKRIGMPWERPREGGIFDRYWDTAIGVMNHATETFGEMKVTGGMGAPLRFLLLGAIFGSLIGAVYGAVGQTITTFADANADGSSASELTVTELGDGKVLVSGTVEFGKTGEEGGEEAAVGPVVTTAMIMFMVVAFFGTFFGGIIGGIIHTFLQAAGLQLALPIVGVKQPSFEKNFRVAAYTNGSIFLCNIVPGLGGAFMLFLWFNGMIKGLESVYEIPNKTAVLAVLLLFIPLVLPIVVVVGLFALTMLGYIG